MQTFRTLKLDFEDLSVETFEMESATQQAAIQYVGVNPDTEDKLCTETACNAVAAAAFAC